MFFGLFSSPKYVTENQDPNELLKQFLSCYNARVHNRDLLNDYQDKFIRSDNFQIDSRGEILFDTEDDLLSVSNAKYNIVLYHLALVSKLIFCNSDNLNQNSVLFSLVKTILYAIKYLGFNNSLKIENGTSALICAFLFEHDESSFLTEIKWFKRNRLLENVLLENINFNEQNLSELNQLIPPHELRFIKQKLQYIKGLGLFWNQFKSDIFCSAVNYKNISKYNGCLLIPGKCVDSSEDFIIFSLIRNGVRIYNNFHYANSFLSNEGLGSCDKNFEGPVFVLETTYDQIHKNIIVWGIQTDDRRGVMMSLSDIFFETMSVFIINNLVKYDPEFFADEGYSLEDLRFSNKRTYYLFSTPLFFYLNNNSQTDALFIPHDGTKYLRGSSSEIYEQIGIPFNYR